VKSQRSFCPLVIVRAIIAAHLNPVEHTETAKDFRDLSEFDNIRASATRDWHSCWLQGDGADSVPDIRIELEARAQRRAPVDRTRTSHYGEETLAEKVAPVLHIRHAEDASRLPAATGISRN